MATCWTRASDIITHSHLIPSSGHTVDRESSFDLFTVKSSQVSEIFCFAVFKQEFMDLLYSLSSGQRKVRTIIQINWEIVLQLQVDLSVSDSEVFHTTSLFWWVSFQRSEQCTPPNLFYFLWWDETLHFCKRAVPEAALETVNRSCMHGILAYLGKLLAILGIHIINSDYIFFLKRKENCIKIWHSISPCYMN